MGAETQVKVSSSAWDARPFSVYTSSPVYRALGAHEFRLASLSAVNDSHYPIHLVLETFQHDECPEYEKVSYTWGGESGDSTQCCPIYVGEYWDVLLQTSNCQSMLRYLRCQKNTRVVWMDAICAYPDRS
ncbi:hypothetical protein K469DRAFT_99468 [Zopfia rhizophila CBS 207.26]|uniref:Heterokaryon incompatibility domain-containing protein n=1 Tax=Zopfia rhizophila CBS 207.26 TaxID=1314779 RepID=A0A6A6EA85_9PEZI|nr:hypothetical protein K469DRAFT_99468 [Zopfia rhizophila CBS 207.26]